MRLLLAALGLLIGALLALQYGRGGASGSTVTAPQALLQALTGGPPEEKLLFSSAPTAPTVPVDLLPAGIPVVYAFYELPDVRTAGLPKAQWSKNGVIKGQIPAASITPAAEPGSGMIALRAPEGAFAPGVYEVEVAFEGSKVAGSFVTAWAAEAIIGQPAPRDAEVVIKDACFATAVGTDGKPQPPRKTFYGTDRIYFVFRYGQAEPGSTVQVKWYGANEAIESAEREVLLPSVAGWAHAWLQAPMPGLPPGQYRAAVCMSSDTHELTGGSFGIAEGVAPPSPTPQR
jgi:hypothetical protein